MRKNGLIEHHFPFNIKPSPQHFPLGTKFKKSDIPLGKDDPNMGKVLTVTGFRYNGPGSFVLYHDGVEFLEGVPNTVNAYWVTEIVERGTGPVQEVVGVERGRDWTAEYVQEALHFVYGRHDPRYWHGVNTNICLKKNYLFFTMHDIVNLLLEKTSKDPGEYWDIDLISKSIRSQSFVKIIRTNTVIDGRKTVAGYVANKKRFNKWFKQNVNRFKKSLNQVRKEDDEMYNQDLNDESADHFEYTDD